MTIGELQKEIQAGLFGGFATEDSSVKLIVNGVTVDLQSVQFDLDGFMELA